VPTKELETMSMVVELLPNAPNIILLDAERRVLSSFFDISPQHGIGEYDTYAYPKISDKLNLEDLLEHEYPELETISDHPTPQSWLISRVAGIGPVFAGELLYRHRKRNRTLNEEIRFMIEQSRSPSQAGWLYTELPLGHLLEQNDLKRLSRSVLSPFELESLERTHSHRSFGNILDAAKFFLDELEHRTLLQEIKLPVLRQIRAGARRFAEREKRLLREQHKYQEAEGLHKIAQMLTSSGMKMDQHYDHATVTDYFGETPKEVQVPLDSAVSLRENIDRMFKRHQKAGRGKDIVARQIGEIRNKRAALEENTRRLQAIKDWDTWLAIASKLPNTQDSPQSLGRPLSDGEASRLKKFRTLKLEDREILVGRNGRDNDELTFNVAAPEDFWFHVSDYSGSHVVVRNPGKDKDLDENVLVKAAQMAAYFSQARNSSKVEVHYTKRRHVTKPRRAKPGLVRLLEFKSIKVEPKNWLNS
jgi:predicted ribosome quality control (RQC) complex YloA/Tae2 family protein